jgi:hypothetical protein
MEPFAYFNKKKQVPQPFKKSFAYLNKKSQGSNQNIAPRKLEGEKGKTTLFT